MPAPVRVLVLDDQSIAIEIVADILESEGGYRVEGVRTITAARTSIAASLPDVLILDIVLGGIGSEDREGRTFLADLRSTPATATLPVILMSAQHVLEEESAGDAHTAQLAKPYDLVELLSVVDRLTPARS